MIPEFSISRISMFWEVLDFNISGNLEIQKCLDLWPGTQFVQNYWKFWKYWSEIMYTFRQICMYVYMYVCMFVVKHECLLSFMSLYGCTYTCMYKCLHACMSACRYVCFMHEYMYICM